MYGPKCIYTNLCNSYIPGKVPMWAKFASYTYNVPYPRERGPMGGAPPKLGGGPIFEVSVSRIYSKERPGKLPMLAS